MKFQFLDFIYNSAAHKSIRKGKMRSYVPRGLTTGDLNPNMRVTVELRKKNQSFPSIFKNSARKHVGFYALFAYEANKIPVR
jgi:hypothetical protein